MKETTVLSWSRFVPTKVQRGTAVPCAVAAGSGFLACGEVSGPRGPPTPPSGGPEQSNLKILVLFFEFDTDRTHLSAAPPPLPALLTLIADVSLLPYSC